MINSNLCLTNQADSDFTVARRSLTHQDPSSGWSLWRPAGALREKRLSKSHLTFRRALREQQASRNTNSPAAPATDTHDDRSETDWLYLLFNLHWVSLTRMPPRLCLCIGVFQQWSILCLLKINAKPVMLGVHFQTFNGIFKKVFFFFKERSLLLPKAAFIWLKIQ